MNGDFVSFFRNATGRDPYDYQRRLANTSNVPPDGNNGPRSLAINVPTGAGKTAAAVLAWAWNRCGHPTEDHRKYWPRRLVYCLPMRVLVEQTAQSISDWLERLGLSSRVGLHVLMGGEEAGDWDLFPEREAILVGTQDMLLSRALSRGYGMSRYRWPLQFGLLNNDALWVIDEIQLMGSGLATTTQLQSFRRQFGTLGNVSTFWMSATLDTDWLATVDFDPTLDLQGKVSVDLACIADEELRRRMEARKALRRTVGCVGDSKQLAREILAAHQPGTRTLVVVNTVQRAVDLHSEIGKRSPTLNPILVHSRFRAPDRKRIVENLLAPPGPDGTVIVSTQVIEAGVDLSSTTLFSELAPWSSLVQRFGRCNRTGLDANAAVYWIDLPTTEKQHEKLARPYTAEALITARSLLLQHRDGVGPSMLQQASLGAHHGHVIRRRDIEELFDTTPDLAGNDIDVSRFIRETDDHDVQVFWRALPEDGPGESEPEPDRNELCSVPIGDIRDLADSKAKAWTWDQLDGRWVKLNRQTPVYPGLLIMLTAADGRYTTTEGWSPNSGRPVPVVVIESPDASRAYAGDWMSEKAWLTLVEHTNKVVAVANDLIAALGLGAPLADTLGRAMRWHDAGKAHPVFQQSLRGNSPTAPAGILAKTVLRNIRHERRGFRHELASGILALLHGEADLVAYLAASHHGKVRLSIRSLPDETRPPEKDRRFARGIWDGERIPAEGSHVDLGGGTVIPATEIDLSFMDLGDGLRGPSWLARMLALRDRADLGPFRLALLEALMKSADERASGETP